MIEKYITDIWEYWISDYAKLYIIHSPYTTNILKELAKESKILAKRKLFQASLPRQATWKVPDDLPFFDARLIVETSALFIAASFRIRLLDMHWIGKCVFFKCDNLKCLQPCDPVDLQLQVPAKVQLGCSWSVSEKSWRKVHLWRCSALVFFGIFSGLNDLAFNPLTKSSLTAIFASEKQLLCLACHNGLSLRFWFQSFSTSSDTSFECEQFNIQSPSFMEMYQCKYHSCDVSYVCCATSPILKCLNLCQLKKIFWQPWLRCIEE